LYLIFHNLVVKDDTFVVIFDNLGEIFEDKFWVGREEDMGVFPSEESEGSFVEGGGIDLIG